MMSSPAMCFSSRPDVYTASGAGSFIAEIQETSDITYRIYDFNRRDAQGNTRELHTELANGAIDIHGDTPINRTAYTPAATVEWCSNVVLISQPPSIDMTEPVDVDLKALDSFVVVMCIGGEGSLTDNAGDTVTLRQGETALVPASTAALRFTPAAQGMKLLTAQIGLTALIIVYQINN